jgi:hypothetical protein
MHYLNRYEEAIMAASMTTLDNDATRPSVTAPGDGPADTTDPSEQATSVTPNPGAEAIAAGTVNAVKPAPKRKAAAKSAGSERFEEFEATKPNGDVVTVRRNIETGESRVL